MRRHRFIEVPGRVVCAECGMARGSVLHSRLGSNRYMGERRAIDTTGPVDPTTIPQFLRTGGKGDA